ncbi:hypothetical protein GCM10011533_33100 [Streptosporangium jomthongense]|uniref:DUF7281 domain-containing protein n=1 Tax=Marinobacter aromaticivorans TaxID=1494078 RepID=A0ABW2IZW7_9GAMM|nr:hypothetical protein [Marinobacter aromaticivorans]GGE78117.1 hypothetical protein GCM10011533_33100 [Streptosporangium jomthongense]
MPAEIAAIERLLRGGKTKVRLNPTWEQICRENGVGQVIGREIHFTPDDKQRLRDYVLAEHGIDPQFDSRAGGRMAMARKDASEKLSTASVFGHLLVMATAGQSTVRVTGKGVSTPPGSVLSVLPDCLNAEHLHTQKLIIIENGGLMPHWADLQLTESWKDAVILYRGHRENARFVADIAREQPGHNLAWFFDFDPAGLAMALDQGRGNALIPQAWFDFGRHTAFNQPKTHRNQMNALKRLKVRGVGKVLKIAEHMEKEELALMQEHLVLRQVKMSALSFE